MSRLPLLLLALALPTTAQQANSPSTLAAIRDHYRPVLIFSPLDDPRSQQQVNLLAAHPADLINRQIVLVTFPDLPSKEIDPKIIAHLPVEEASLRRRLHIPPTAFTVLLLGKDGGEKLRSSTLVTMDQLNKLIDAMPMRRQEMKPRPPQ